MTTTTKTKTNRKPAVRAAKRAAREQRLATIREEVRMARYWTSRPEAQECADLGWIIVLTYLLIGLRTAN